MRNALTNSLAGNDGGTTRYDPNGIEKSGKIAIKYTRSVVKTRKLYSRY